MATQRIHQSGAMSKPSINVGRSLAVAASVVVLLALFFSFGPSKASSPLHFTKSEPGSTADGSLESIQNATLGVSGPRHPPQLAFGVEVLVGRTLTLVQFQKLFAINLPSRTDHRDQMSSAAHFTGLQIDYADGVREVDSKTLPPGGDPNAHIGVLGSWRAHLNIMRRYVP